MDWTEHGILISLGSQGVFLKTKDSNKFEQLSLPDDIKYIKDCKFSPDGSLVLFFGAKYSNISRAGYETYLFVRNIETGKLSSVKLAGNFFSSEQQATWIYPDRPGFLMK